MNAAINHDTLAARRTVAEQLSVIRTLLRLLDPASPFQPILVGSVDLIAWQAFFGRATETIEAELPRAIAPLPPASRRKITAAAKSLFSVAHSICDAPQVHMSDRAAELNDCGQLPDLSGLDPDPVRSPEEETLVEEALESSEEFRDRTNKQLTVLRRNLDSSTDRLIKTLTRKHGLMWLLQRDLKTSKKASGQFQQLATELEAVLASPPPSSGTPWEDARGWFVRLAHVIEVRVAPELNAVLKCMAARTGRAATTRHKAAIPKRQSLKNAFNRAWDLFLQTYSAVGSVESAQHAQPLWKLFSGLIQELSTAMIDEGVQEGTAATSCNDNRLVEEIRVLDQRIVRPSILAAWQKTLAPEDEHAKQIALAGMHYLERPDEDNGETPRGRMKVIYGFSEATMARWLRQGGYKGHNPDREASGALTSEARRTRRTLQHLHRHQAAFHGRRNWTPLPAKISKSTSDRFWTLNPLLVLMPQIRTAVAGASAAAAALQPTPATRQRPSRRNRGTRQKNLMPSTTPRRPSPPAGSST